MSEPDEKEPAELWRGRCSGCTGYARWNGVLGLWEPCECRDDGDEDESEENNE